MHFVVIKSIRIIFLCYEEYGLKDEKREMT
jgi:hypothetical protein